MGSVIAHVFGLGLRGDAKLALMAGPPSRPADPESGGTGQTDDRDDSLNDRGYFFQGSYQRRRDRGSGEKLKNPTAEPSPLPALLNAVGADRAENNHDGNLEQREHGRFVEQLADPIPQLDRKVALVF